MRLHVGDIQFLSGCSAGLAEPTAVVEIGVTGAVAVEEVVLARRVRAGVAAMCPDRPLPSIGENDWPRAFLVEEPERDDCRLGGWLVALAVTIQQCGLDPVWRGRVVSADAGRWLLAVPWRREGFCVEAVTLATELMAGWLGGDEVADRWLAQHFDGRWEAIQAGGLSPYTMSFIQAGVRRGMPFDILPSWVQLGWGANAERFDMAITGNTGWIASMLAKNKSKANRTLAAAAIPVPPAHLVDSAPAAEQAAVSLGWPVVVKPVDQDIGVGITTHVDDLAGLRQAYDHAYRVARGKVLVEKHIDGDDYRILVAGGRMLMAVRRLPAGVNGDGLHTVTDLVAAANADPRRGVTRFSPLKRLRIDEEAMRCLEGQGLQPDSVPEPGRFVRLRDTGAISTGGTAEDVTAVIHPDNAALAERAARVIGLDLAGVDFLTTDISRSFLDAVGVICEVNAQPGFSPHWLADPGRDIDGEVLDMLVSGRPVRIPTAAITGTNGKSTTAEMLYRIWTAAGALTGVCTTQVLRIGAEIVHVGNLSGQPGARVILNDPGVQAGVFEMPRKGLINFGHPCDSYDVAALLNLSDDHLGVDGIDTLEQMAELKAEVLARARRAVVVNADDPLCLAMRARAGTDRHVLVTRDPANPAVVEHRRRGGEAVVLQDHEGRACIVLAVGETDDVLMAAGEIPATRNGLLRHNETNAMFAAALAWTQGVAPATIRSALGRFGNSVAENPGPYNVIDSPP